MRAAIIPLAKLAIFDVELSPCIRVGPVPIYAGPHAGKFAVNEAILTSCPEWVEKAARALEICAENGVPITEIDPAHLVNPNAINP